MEQTAFPPDRRRRGGQGERPGFDRAGPDHRHSGGRRMKIETRDLVRLCPNSAIGILKGFEEHAPRLLPIYGMTTSLRWCHFIAQIAHESAGLSRTTENLNRSEEHTSELQSLMRISYAVFCLKKKKTKKTQPTNQYTLQHR